MVQIRTLTKRIKLLDYLHRYLEKKAKIKFKVKDNENLQKQKSKVWEHLNRFFQLW